MLGRCATLWRTVALMLCGACAGGRRVRVHGSLEPPQRLHLRRCPLPPSGGGAEARRAGGGGHARARAGPHRARHAQAGQPAVPGAGRGRPDARHGLQGRHPEGVRRHGRGRRRRRQAGAALLRHAPAVGAEGGQAVHAQRPAGAGGPGAGRGRQGLHRRQAHRHPRTLVRRRTSAGSH